jgi:ATP-dependent protease ClpP protease subunit
VPLRTSRYRENHRRAIYVFGEINEELLHKLTPEINELRCEKQDPITVYIDSIGGAIPVAERLRGLLVAPTPEGVSCPLVTVVTGIAGSAAADLLALGEYAIALPNADILYHGSRQQMRSPLTYELATSLASQIKETNEWFALRLAREVFSRMVFRVSQFEKWLSEYRSSTSTEIKGLIAELQNKLRVQNRRLIWSAARRQSAIWELVSFVNRHLAKFKRALQLPILEAEILRAIVKYRTQRHAKDPWLLSLGGLNEVNSDFELFNDFYFGDHRESMTKIVGQFGQLFLADSDRKALLESDDEEFKNKMLEAKAKPKLEPLWYLMISICRILQSDDFTLNAAEAYWLGLVDEVQGSDLPNLRELVENADKDDLSSAETMDAS